MKKLLIVIGFTILLIAIAGAITVSVFAQYNPLLWWIIIAPAVGACIGTGLATGAGAICD